MAAKQRFAELFKLGKAAYDKKERDEAAKHFTEVRRIFPLVFHEGS